MSARKALEHGRLGMEAVQGFGGGQGVVAVGGSNLDPSARKSIPPLNDGEWRLCKTEQKSASGR